MRFYGFTTALWITPFLCFTLLHLSILVHPYTPVDLFTLNCGSSGNSSDNDRSWIGDINSKLLSLTDSPNSSIALEALTQSPSAQQVPYSTARLSRSQFSYSFPVTQGPKFLRLFFYPASYPGFDRFNAVFTVKSGGVTLLKDFNASLNANFENRDTVFREYCIYVVDGERLNLTFTANTTNPDLYAFVNGIEIVSMPDDLYYSEPSGLGFKLVGTSIQYNLENKYALETLFRFGVGGQGLSPRDDTGMLRLWGNDDDYLHSNSALSSDIEELVKLIFSQVPNYTAPDQIYRRERNMGRNKTANKNSNLTWTFLVDSNFTYMLRLHFCELDPNIDYSSNRLFNIYIADQLAEEGANVLNWGKGRGVPVYRDYAILISGHKKTPVLSLNLHPSPKFSTNSEYSDAFLNGLEIFKISDPQTNSLAGPNPDPPPPSPPNSVQKHAKKSGKSRFAIIIGVVIGVALLIIILASGVVFFLINHRKKTKDIKSSDGTSKWTPVSFTTTKSATNSHGSSLPSKLCHYFSIADIRAATNNFDELFNVGVGGFGNVYKGYINDGQTPVAIKRLKPGSQQGVHEFQTEIEMLSQLRHLHLVSLIGYCNESNEMILVYDFMERGTLRSHLYNTENPALSWKQRLQICLGAARGLHYLHTGAMHMIIHRDVKTTNILLDEKWMAKVSDFGLSRIGPTGMNKAHVSTVVKGSIGYVDPEYYKRQRLTEKSDVYSFGVVLFEVLCGRPPIIRTSDKRQVLLVDWARRCFQMGTLAQIVDPALRGKIASECLRKFAEIAVSCLLDDGSHRPSMNDVVWGLEFALQLQENAEQREKVRESGEEGREENINNEEGGNNKSGGEDSDEIFSSSNNVGIVSDFNKSSGVSGISSSNDNYKESEIRLISGSVFSEIMDPKAR
ncbi:receptor-like protein kinase FERONIA [Senna tora]|uniref:Receptor-like protein kinase FERONIA n=1 Tax=Senna tora TaxID=362788 RepID=A0A834THP6_9FABA|nr:receptor-like protein kinase FERONIA [Senna tora]